MHNLAGRIMQDSIGFVLLGQSQTSPQVSIQDNQTPCRAGGTYLHRYLAN
jgi:hypothetical protein